MSSGVYTVSEFRVSAGSHVYKDARIYQLSYAF